jgi:glycosyltransferase involved in cell wall biosynthesis
MHSDEGARVCLGLLLHNDERHLREALEALLDQTYRAFTLIVVDDGSTDGTAALVREYAARDARLHVVIHPTRMGYCFTYRHAFELAPAGIAFFAWAAGHDVHERTWLERMVAALDADPDAVVAYPLTVRISDSGERYDVPSPRFDTSGLGRAARLRALSRRGVGFGNIIYGLFRARALRRAGVFRNVLLPDTLLAWELSLHGTIRQVPEPLWRRRYVGLFSLARQRRNGFRKAPWYTYVPPPIVNSLVLLWSTALSGAAGPLSDRVAGGSLALRFFLKYGMFAPVATLAARSERLRHLYRAVRRRENRHKEA